jgi:2-polyprenyl-3-methyl-5-hydroxy-6-metoxy-1,4-benzoquinol methylase
LNESLQVSGIGKSVEYGQIAMTHPFSTDKEIDDLYSTGNYRTDVRIRFNPIVENLVYQATVVKRKRIEKYAKIGEIIDIGCGRGLFLDVMSRGGWDVFGLELNKQTSSYAEHEAYVFVFSFRLDCFVIF